MGIEEKLDLILECLKYVSKGHAIYCEIVEGLGRNLNTKCTCGFSKMARKLYGRDSSDAAQT